MCWITKISYATISLAWNCPRAKNKLIFPGRERKPPVISYQDVPESNAITGAEKQSTGVCDSMKKQVSSPVLSKAGGDSKLNEVAVQIKTKLLEKSYFTKRLKVQNYRGLVKLSIVGLG